MKPVPITTAILGFAALHQYEHGVSAFVSPTQKCYQYITSVHNQQQPYQRMQSQQKQILYMSTTDTTLETEVKGMRVSAIKQELESYGISTKTFLEKSELVDALVQARRDGKTPIVSSSSTSTSSSSESTTTTSSSSSTATSGPATDSADRQAKIQLEMEKCKSMKVGELKSELESYGISTKSFFEKSEFVKAVSEARVDGVTKKSKKKKRRSSDAVDDDDDDDEVEEVKAKVEVITSDNVGPKTKKNRDTGSSGGGGNPFGGGAGGSPFGGAGGPGGMGGMDMGGIADMLKGMGVGGAAGNPFGGAGGSSPFGAGGAGMAEAMKAAQAAMSNPKVQAVVQKAQKNPKVMQAVQECMGNPMAMSKYMSDPEVGPILKELQEAMM